MEHTHSFGYFPKMESIVDTLCNATLNQDRAFFRILTSYMFCKLASTQRINVTSLDSGPIPVNMYALNLATSGHGKGHSTSILEGTVTAGFRTSFLNQTFPVLVQERLAANASRRALITGVDPAQELLMLEKEFASAGPMLYSFDSGTAPALKQLRYKLLLAEAGALSIEIDEIGSNLIPNTEILNVFLELFDIGVVKQKLVKSTQDSFRGEDIQGRTPANMLMFGTPADLLDGAKTEDEFMAMLKKGFARRCFYSVNHDDNARIEMTPQQVFDMLTDKSSDAIISGIADDITSLADRMYHGIDIEMPKDVSLIFIEYRQNCERLARDLGEHEEVRKSELSHRYFKARKLAGAYAFIDKSPVITKEHAYYALALTEDSGAAFNQIVKRSPNYVKLAKYIVNSGTELTQADLSESLPFYRGSQAQRNEMLQLATAYCYKNSMVIKKNYINNIEILTGESLKETDLDALILSHSNHYSENYRREAAPFSKLPTLLKMDKHQWCNHAFDKGHRSEDDTIPEFNLLVLDVDGTATLSEATSLLKEYTAYFTTTKSHGVDGKDHFRIIIPLSHELHLNKEDYTEFMQCVYKWLPFEVDTATCDRTRKWETHAGCTIVQNEGVLLDVHPFIPQTSQNEMRKKQILDFNSLSNLERWFAMRMSEGNRNQNMLRYAMCLVDGQQTEENVETLVKALNDKIQQPLPEDELNKTVLRSVSKAIALRDNKGNP